MLDEEVKVGFNEMVAFEQKQKQMREGDIQASWRRELQTEGRDSVKALRQSVSGIFEKHQGVQCDR